MLMELYLFLSTAKKYEFHSGSYDLRLGSWHGGVEPDFALHGKVAGKIRLYVNTIEKVTVKVIGRDEDGIAPNSG